MVSKNNLIMNTEKTIAISFHSKYMRSSPRLQITFKNIKINCQSRLRFLGIFIMENLTWGAYARPLTSQVVLFHVLISPTVAH
jgi:hypothetical protein